MWKVRTMFPPKLCYRHRKWDDEVQNINSCTEWDTMDFIRRNETGRWHNYDIFWPSGRQSATYWGSRIYVNMVWGRWKRLVNALQTSPQTATLSLVDAWLSSDQITENQIDHICISLDVQIKRGADAATDYHLLVNKGRWGAQVVSTIFQWTPKSTSPSKCSVNSRGCSWAECEQWEAIQSVDCELIQDAKGWESNWPR